MITRALCVVVLALAPAAGLAQVVDHADVDGVATLPQAVMDSIGQQRWLFTHASVGGNMCDGLVELHTQNAARYQLVLGSVDFDDPGQSADPPPAPTTPGTVYECWRGNPGWSAKVAIFDNSVRNAGWHQTAVDVALDKMCYIDQDADAATYLASMDALAADFPTTVMVYATMPLMTGEDADNVLRNQYNQAVRDHCLGTGALLFDIADMEAFDPAGNPQTFQYGGETYQKLYAGYTDDGGHLNAAGRQRVALGWYAVAATLAGDPVFADGFESGTTGGWDATSP